jgi:hypothetical protein
VSENERIGVKSVPDIPTLATKPLLAKMADEDFEIDIYGSAENDAQEEPQNQDANAQAYDSNASITIANGSNDSSHTQTNSHVDYDAEGQDGQEEMEETARDETPAKSQQPQQGVKRKEGSDNRPIDPGATNCLMISELNWWQTDDDIRKWVVQANCEEELKDITFSEHKVNGKSKGLVIYTFLSTPALHPRCYLFPPTEDANSAVSYLLVYCNFAVTNT